MMLLLLARSPQRPRRLELSLGPFFTLTAGSLGLRGVTELISGDVISGAHDLAAIAPAPHPDGTGTCPAGV